MRVVEVTIARNAPTFDCAHQFSFSAHEASTGTLLLTLLTKVKMLTLIPFSCWQASVVSTCTLMNAQVVSS